MIPCGGLELHVCVADFADAAAHRFPKTPAPFADCPRNLDLVSLCHAWRKRPFIDRTAWVQVPLRELTLHAQAFGCGWASVALGLDLGRLALGRLALGRLALGLALAAQLLQPRAPLFRIARTNAAKRSDGISCKFLSLCRERHFGWFSSSTMPAISVLRPSAASSAKTHLETVARVCRRCLARLFQLGHACK